MSFERADFRAYQDRRKKERVQERQAELRQVAQAAPAMTVLTGHSEWDTFLAVLEAMKQQAENALRLVQANLAQSFELEPTQLVSRKVQAMMIQERIAVIEEIIAKPAELLEAGKKAQEMVDAAERE
jgi:ketopantoate hydroxymethyltransferase